MPTLIKYRSLCFILALTAAVCFLPGSIRLRLDRSLENMFSESDPVRRNFEQLQRTFGVSDLVVFAYRDSDLWNADGRGLIRLQGIREQLEQLPGVDSAMDLSKLNQILKQWNAATSIFSLAKSNSDFPLLSTEDPIATAMKKLFEGQTHSPSSDLIAIACILKKPSHSTGSVTETLAAMRTITVGAGQIPMLAGQRVMVEEGFEEIEKDGVRLGYFSIISLSLLLLIGFRSLRWALINIALIQWSLVVSRGLMVAFRWDITMVSSMMSSLVTVIAVATLMHWLIGYRTALRTGSLPEDALRVSWLQLRRPIAWACITDAIAFAALGISKVGPVQDYGYMMALSSLVVLLGIVMLVPAMALTPLLSRSWEKRLGIAADLNLTYHENNEPKTEKSLVSSDRLSNWLVNLLNTLIPRSRVLVLGSLIAFAISLWGASLVQVETNFIQNFRPGSPIVQAYEAIENDLGGAGVWDVIIPIEPTLGTERTEAIRELERELREIRLESQDAMQEKNIQLSSVMSAIDADDVWSKNRLLRGLSFDVRFNAVRALLGSFAESLIAVDFLDKPPQRMLRIMLRSQEQLEANEKLALIDAVQSAVNKYSATNDLGSASSQQQAAIASSANRPQGIVSGYYVLLTSLVSSIVSDQWICLGVATIGVWLALVTALRNFLLPTLALLPNLLPSMLIMSWFGWTGTPINLGAAMIAAVSLGISVDSSLHYLYRFQMERKKNRTVMESLKCAQSEIGLSVTLATLALVLGFGSLSVSDFLPTVVFGTTAAISMIGSMVGNLFLLPSLVHLFSRK
ncbi:MAG: efflux RND transporter permease subunit [Pirellula sp.]